MMWGRGLENIGSVKFLSLAEGTWPLQPEHLPSLWRVAEMMSFQGVKIQLCLLTTLYLPNWNAIKTPKTFKHSSYYTHVRTRTTGIEAETLKEHSQRCHLGLFQPRDYLVLEIATLKSRTEWECILQLWKLCKNCIFQFALLTWFLKTHSLINPFVSHYISYSSLGTVKNEVRFT